MSGSLPATIRAALSASHTAVEKFDVDKIENAQQALAFISATFEEPITIDGPPKGPIPKATLTVGAGKLDRARFDEDLPKWITAALREIDYVEDRGASALEACMGTYKYQHDTGKNEKYVHVFPRCVRTAGSEAAEDDAPQEEVLSGADRAEKLCIESSLETFKLLCDDKIKPWLCRKRLTTLLQETVDKLIVVEEKLTRMVKPDPLEQKLFDSTDRELLVQKIEWLRAEMIAMVDDLHLNKREMELALTQATAKLAELEAVKDTPAARLDALRARVARLEKALADSTFYRHPLKHEQKIKEFWGKSLALMPLAEKAGTKGRWSSKLTPAEVALLGEQEHFDAEAERLAQLSRFWFEEEDELAARVKGAKALVKVNKRPQPKSYASVSSHGGSKTSSASSSWSTVASTKSKPSYASAASGAKKPTNAFGALGDSDSD